MKGVSKAVHRMFKVTYTINKIDGAENHIALFTDMVEAIFFLEALNAAEEYTAAEMSRWDYNVSIDD